MSNQEYYQERTNIPFVAALASLLVAGGGQLYNRYFLRGLGFMGAFWLAYLTFGAFAFVITTGSIIEAVLVSLEDRRNRDEG